MQLRAVVVQLQQERRMAEEARDKACENERRSKGPVYAGTGWASLAISQAATDTSSAQFPHTFYENRSGIHGCVLTWRQRRGLKAYSNAGVSRRWSVQRTRRAVDERGCVAHVLEEDGES